MIVLLATLSVMRCQVVTCGVSTTMMPVPGLGNVQCGSLSLGRTHIGTYSVSAACS